MEEDNDIRALAREKEADQEQHHCPPPCCSWSAFFSLASALMSLSSSMLFLVCFLFSCQFSDVIVLFHVVLGLPPFLTITSEHWQEKRKQIKNNMEEDNNIRALAREKEADQEQHGGGQ
jgi:hypothetical protein